MQNKYLICLIKIIRDSKPEKLIKKIINKSDIIIIVADNVLKKAIRRLIDNKIIKKDIPDCDVKNKEKIKENINNIEKKIISLINNLKNSSSI